MVVMVFEIDHGIRRIQGTLEVGVFIARTVARVDDFVVVRVVDVQLGRADTDNGPCSVSGQLAE